ncbi:C-GCAxxG-C-C family protein [Desulfosporosinus orientis]|uniref:C-GCAxxG-C-C family protein n=1 Tax=Desulfosporosinus orientis TaxID=1563 RepID=UPI0005AAF126|nr:C-GCAxxG-C-C family protein [Desulfosporosinus orientis]
MLTTLGEELGIERKQALRLATGFGAGIAYQGNICGAVSGAIMAIGLKHGNDEPSVQDFSNKAIFLTRELIQRITAKHGCYTCKGLTGIDHMNLEEGMKFYRELGIAEKICRPVIIDCIEIVEEIW